MLRSTSPNFAAKIMLQLVGQTQVIMCRAGPLVAAIKGKNDNISLDVPSDTLSSLDDDRAQSLIKSGVKLHTGLLFTGCAVVVPTLGRQTRGVCLGAFVFAVAKVCLPVFAEFCGCLGQKHTFRVYAELRSRPASSSRSVP